MKIINFSGIKTLFFDNKTVRQTIFKNTFWLAIASGTNKLFAFFLLIYVARIFGPDQYGKFTFALAFILLFGIFSNMGLSRVTVRELSRGEEGEKDYPALLSLKILLILGTLIVIIVGSFFITPDPIVRKAIWILAGYVMIGNFAQIIYEFLESRQKMEYEALAKILESVLHVSLGLFVIFNFPSIENLAYGYLISILVFMLLFLSFFHFKIYRLYFSWNTLIWKKYLRMSWPLALTGFFATIYGYIDSVMMGYWNMTAETGWYNAAYRIITVTIIPASIIATSFFPALSKSFKDAREKFQKIWNYQIETMLSLSVPLMIGGIVLAPKIINFVFGSIFDPSILAFQILIIMAGIIHFYTTFYWALIIANQQKKTFLVGLAGAATNIILNLILIPKFGLYGAATSAVITYFLMLAFFVIFTSKFTDINTFNFDFWRNLIGITLCGGIMYFIISFPTIYGLHLFFLIAIGAGTYLTCLYGYKKIIGKLLFKIKSI